MKNRIISILLAAVLALSAGLVGCASEYVPEVTEYNLAISSTAGGSVTVPGEGTFTYDEGTAANLVAEAEEDYQFINWTGLVGTVADVNDASTTITMDDHYYVTANFAYGSAIPPKNPGSFVQMVTGGVGSLDPAWGYMTPGGREQVQYIYETLIFYDGEKTDQFVPVLATEWELLDDNLTYRFKIREGVKFHEGGDLTPEDVEYSFQRIMIQENDAGPARTFFRMLLDVTGAHDASFADIDGAVEVDGEWIVFHLCDPAWALPFLQMICGPWSSIVDKEWCVASGEWDGTEQTWEDYNGPDISEGYLYNHTNGTGPWKLEEWDPGNQIRLVRNDDYWREPAAFEAITTQFVEEWTTRKAALLAGDADFVDALLPIFSFSYIEHEDIAELEDVEDLKVYKDLLQLIPDAFWFNMAIDPDSTYIGSGGLDGNGIPTDFFNDIDVRKGFNYAFDWQTFIDDAYMGDARQLGSPVCEGVPYFNPDASMYSLDLNKAEEHLKLAWGGEVWEKGFKFTLLHVPGDLRREIACKILAENLFAINPRFQVCIQLVDPGAYTYGMGHRTMPMFHAGRFVEYPDPHNFVMDYMHSSGLMADLQAYHRTDVDALIEAGRFEPDPAARQSIYYQLQERYYEDAPSIMLCQPLGRRYFTRYINGFYYNPVMSVYEGLPLYHISKSES